MKQKKTSFLYTLSFLSTAALANDVIHVEAEKLPYNIKESYQKIHILTEDDINLASTQSLSELISQFSQIYTVNKGGSGQAGSVFIRGMDSYHTTVVVDGVVVNDPTDPNRAFNFNQLNVADIERIEILKGAQAQLFSTNSLGGVIFIRTKRAKDSNAIHQFHTHQSYENKTWGEKAFSLSRRQKIDKLGYKIAGDFTSSGARSALITPPGRAEEKDRVVSKNINLNLDYEVNEKNYLETSLKYKNNKIPYDETYPLNAAANNQANVEEKALNVLHSGQFTEQFSTETSLAITENQRNLKTSSTYYSYRGKSQQANIHFLYQTSMSFDYSLSTHFLNEEIRFNEGSGNTKKNAHQTGISIGFQKKSLPNLNSFFYSGSVRRDQHSKFQDAYSYRAVLGNHFENDTLKFSVVRGHNPPSLYTLFGFGGNEFITPEKSLQGELSLERKLSSQMNFILTYFKTQFDDKFQYNSTSSKMENIGGARIDGLEGELNFNSNRETISLSASYLNAKAVNQSKKLAYRPTTLTKLHYQRIINDSLKAGFLFQAVGKQFDSNQDKRDKYTLFDFFIKHQIYQSPLNELILGLELKNVFNKGYILERNYSQAGRSLIGSLDYKF